MGGSMGKCKSEKDDLQAQVKQSMADMAAMSGSITSVQDEQKKM